MTDPSVAPRTLSTTTSTFGMTVVIPPDLSVIDQEGRNEIYDFRVHMGAGNANNLTAAADAAKLTSVNIFTAFKYPEGTPVPFNQNIVCVAQRVSSMPGIIASIFPMQDLPGSLADW